MDAGCARPLDHHGVPSPHPHCPYLLVFGSGCGPWCVESSPCYVIAPCPYLPDRDGVFGHGLCTANGCSKMFMLHGSCSSCNLASRCRTRYAIHRGRRAGSGFRAIHRLAIAGRACAEPPAKFTGSGFSANHRYLAGRAVLCVSFGRLQTERYQHSA